MSAALERLGIADVDLSPAPELAEALVQCGRGEDAVDVCTPTAGAQPPRGSRGRSPARRGRRASSPTTRRSPAGSSRRCAGTNPRQTRSSARAASWPTASACGARAGAATRARTCARRLRLSPARRGAVGRARPARARGDRRDDAQARPEHARPAHAARAADRARSRLGADHARGSGQALSQPQDGRVPPAQRLSQARHRLADRACRGVRPYRSQMTSQRLLHIGV